MAGLDLSKQVGPLPLGAWLAVVAGGLGIAWYTTRTGGPPQEARDTSGTPGVGVGAPAPWTPIEGGGGGQQQPPAPTTNEQWAQKAIGWLIAQGYPPNVSDSAVRKYITAAKLSVQEYTLIGLVLIAIGPPPQTLPPGEDPDPTPTPDPDPDPTPTPTPVNIPYFEAVPHYVNLYDWTRAIGAKYNFHYDFDKMTQLNPGIRLYIKWLPPAPGTDYKIPVFYKGTPPVRLRW
jgi:hypothetical protein